MTETTTDRPSALAKLREKFPDSSISKLPKVNCYKCTQAAKDRKGDTCDEHRKTKCATCGNYITSGHTHLAYVGHAETTDRLLDADPEWTWEPLSVDDRGLPAYDGFGGLWIRLTVGGVTRLGYGSADGKPGPNGIKEAIGDAIRNASMRFGVALDLWAKTDLHADEHDDTHGEETARHASGPADDQWSTGPAMATAAQLNELAEGLLAVRGADSPEAQLRAVSQILKREVGAEERLTRADADTVVAKLREEDAQEASLRKQDDRDAKRSGASDGGWSTPAPSPMVPTITGDQIRELGTLLYAKRSQDQNSWNQIISTMVRRSITEAAQLTKAEAGSIIERLKTEPDLPGAPAPAPAVDGPPPVGTPANPKITEAQMRMLIPLLKQAVGDDDARGRELCGRIIGRPITSKKNDLSKADASRIIEALSRGELPNPVIGGTSPAEEGIDVFAALDQMILDTVDEKTFVETQKAIDAEAAAGQISAEDAQRLRDRLADHVQGAPAGAAA